MNSFTAQVLGNPFLRRLGARTNAARVFNSANISIANNTLTALPFDSERRDDGNVHSTLSNTSRLTVQTSGWHLVTATVEFAFNAAGYRQLAFFINGAAYIASQLQVPDATLATQVSLATLWYFAAGNYVEAHVRQTSGGALNIQNGATYSPEFAIALLK